MPNSHRHYGGRRHIFSPLVLAKADDAYQNCGSHGYGGRPGHSITPIPALQVREQAVRRVAPDGIFGYRAGSSR